jgi:hypothetical protein
MYASLVLTVVLTACGSKGSGGGSDSQPSGSPVYDANGECSPGLRADINALQVDAQNMMKDFATKFPATLDNASQAQARIALQTEAEALKAKVEAFKAKYGSFSCQYTENGMVYLVDPTALYQQIDKLNSPPKETAVASDGSCPPDLANDYAQMQTDAKPHMQRVMELAGDMLGNLSSSLNVDYDKLQMKSEFNVLLPLIQGFRDRHPGNFSCNLVQEDGSQRVLNSAELDTQLQNFTDQMSKL